MKSGRVGEHRAEEIVVPGSEALQDVREVIAFTVSQVQKSLSRSSRNYEGLERPHCPERNERDKSGVLAHYPALNCNLALQIVTEKRAASAVVMRAHPLHLSSCLIRDRDLRPYLPVGMGIAATHHLAAILEDEYVVNRRIFSQLSDLIGPHIDHTPDCGGFHVHRSLESEAIHADPGRASRRPAQQSRYSAHRRRLHRRGMHIEVSSRYATDG